MTMQEWKAKINGFFQPKSQAERQKMMKYLVVMPAAILCAAVILWLLYSSLNKSDELVGDAFNTEIPEGENDGMKDKMSEYEAAEAAKEKETRQQTVAVLDTLTAITPQDNDVRQPSAVETSAQAYQEVQASLDDFFVPESSEAAQVAELQARIDELEAQNAMAQQQQPDQMEMLERSYQLAAQYMGNGNGGNYPPPASADDEKGKRNVQPVAQVSRNVVSSLSASSSRSFNTSGRFIQENDPRFVDDGDGESQLLLPAQRQGIDQCVSFVLQIKDPEQFVRLRFQLFFRQTVDAAVQTDILPYLQVAVKGKLLAHIADMPLDQFRFLIDIETGNLSHPGSRCQKAAQHTHGCRLAGSVRSQETEDLSLAYRETDVVDSGKGTETFR